MTSIRAEEESNSFFKASTHNLAHTNPFDLLGNLVASQEIEERKQLQHEAHMALDPLWHVAGFVLHNNEKATQDFRSNLYRLIAYINDDKEGMINPRTGQETHMSTMQNYNMPKVCKMVNFLLREKNITRIIEQVESLSKTIIGIIDQDEKKEEWPEKKKQNDLKYLEMLKNFVDGKSAKKQTEQEKQTISRKLSKKRNNKKNHKIARARCARVYTVDPDKYYKNNRKSKGPLKDNEYYKLALARIDANISALYFGKTTADGYECDQQYRDKFKILNEIFDRKSQNVDRDLFVQEFLYTCSKAPDSAIEMKDAKKAYELSKPNNHNIKDTDIAEHLICLERLENLYSRQLGSVSNKLDKKRKKQINELNVEKEGLLKKLGEKASNDNIKVFSEVYICNTKIKNSLNQNKNETATDAYNKLRGLLIDPNDPNLDHLDKECLTLFIQTAFEYGPKIENVNVIEDLDYFIKKFDKDKDLAERFSLNSNDINIFLNFAKAVNLHKIDILNDNISDVEDPKEFRKDLQKTMYYLQNYFDPHDCLSRKITCYRVDSKLPDCCYKGFNDEAKTILIESALTLGMVDLAFRFINDSESLPQKKSTLAITGLLKGSINNYKKPEQNSLNAIKDNISFNNRTSVFNLIEFAFVLNKGLETQQIRELSKDITPGTSLKFLCDGAINARDAELETATSFFLKAASTKDTFQPFALYAMRNSLLYWLYHENPKSIESSGYQPLKNCLFNIFKFSGDQQYAIVNAYQDGYESVMNKRNSNFYGIPHSELFKQDLLEEPTHDKDFKTRPYKDVRDYKPEGMNSFIAGAGIFIKAADDSKESLLRYKKAKLVDNETKLRDVNVVCVEFPRIPETPERQNYINI